MTLTVTITGTPAVAFARQRNALRSCVEAHGVGASGRVDTSLVIAPSGVTTVTSAPSAEGP